MRKLLLILLILVVATAALGFYLGWFNFSTSRDPDSGKTGVQLTIDKDKIKGDAKKVKEKVTGGADQSKGQTEEK
jgi:hypothetical protein